MERANKARIILESQMYGESWDMVRQAIIARIEACPLSDTAQAEDLRKCLRLLRDVRANLELTMKQGHLASFELAQKEERRKRTIKDFFR